MTEKEARDIYHQGEEAVVVYHPKNPRQLIKNSYSLSNLLP